MISREEALRILMRSTGDAQPRQGDTLVYGGSGGMYFSPGAIWPTKAVVDAYDVQGRDVVLLCDATGGAFDVYLPPAILAQYRVVVVKKIDSSANAVTVSPYGSELIDGAGSASLSAQWDSVMLVSNGSNWYALAQGV